jgi:hypothetical protein
MSLLDLWKHSPDEFLSKRLWQIIAFAGAGKLVDGGDTSTQLRQILSNAPLEALTRWGHEAVQGEFDDSGLALQDIVNEIGQRLGFSVTPGSYRGGGGKPYDGVWECRTGHRLVVETKTSDNFTIDLTKLADYRRLLPSSINISQEESSVLLVLGRQHTGDYEDRIKGSRYAFVMRVVTVDALLRLLALRGAINGEGALASFSARIFELFTSPRVIALDPVVDFVASAPILPVSPVLPLKHVGGDGGRKDPPDKKRIGILLSKVRAAGATGVRRRDLQRHSRGFTAQTFREALGWLTNSLRLRIEKRGRKIIVVLGEESFKDDLLLALAKNYDAGNLGGLTLRVFATERGFHADVGERVAADLRAEGSVEPKGGSSDIVQFTDPGYQKYLPRIRTLREMTTRAL